MTEKNDGGSDGARTFQDVKTVLYHAVNMTLLALAIALIGVSQAGITGTNAIYAAAIMTVGGLLCAGLFIKLIPRVSGGIQRLGERFGLWEVVTDD